MSSRPMFWFALGVIAALAGNYFFNFPSAKGRGDGDGGS